MNLKQFVKPDFRKISIFELLFILYLVLSLFYNHVYSISAIGMAGTCYVGFSACIENPEDENLQTMFDNFKESSEAYGRAILNIVWHPFTSVLTLGFGDLMTSFIKFQALTVVPSLMPTLKLITLSIYWYLLSCIIVWIFDKVKKK